MKKKINRYLLFVVTITLAATLISAVAVFYHMYQEQIIQDMKVTTQVIRTMVDSGEELMQLYDYSQEEIRITIIGEEGNVLFDSQSEEAELENHADRPEVIAAEETGSGYSVRHSDTMNRDMYYYALMLENGDILRISKEEDSIWSVFGNTIFSISAISIVMIAICYLLSHYATASIVHPIEQLAQEIDCVDSVTMYEELVPFVQTIRQQHEDILKSARMRQEFTANVSHELKTPLTSISGYAELIETGIAGEKEVRRFAAEIRRNAQRLLTLINDIIRLSELDNGHADMTCTEVNLWELAQNCVEMLRIHAEKHELSIVCRGEACTISANKEMIEELLYNLCDNAIRYNRPGGRVEVIVQRVPGAAVLLVKDTGIGIPKESQERVFERFYRVDKSRSKLTGGTGLGLAIVKHIVAQHGAKLELESEVGKGTQMKVTFPQEILE